MTSARQERGNESLLALFFSSSLSRAPKWGRGHVLHLFDKARFGKEKKCREEHRRQNTREERRASKAMKRRQRSWSVFTEQQTEAVTIEMDSGLIKLRAP